MPPLRAIACIDDDSSVLEAMGYFLRSAGYSAFAFASAEDFLNFSDISALYCLITDVKLGGISGMQLLRQLAASGLAVPAIVITAFDDEALRAQSVAAGAIGFLRKPVHEGELLGLLQTCGER
ncbi:response regulator [Paroceanicella profunda]|uniref:Response regulator n=1 Tax=Paroceanicella profunda TaxID=2579971 RepID=A0A5B8FFV0_9RHOB|nr:response regulator [Paroceanicella profunda]QDL90411.1 response regulator [Paroceanicella profunda]